MRVGLLRCVPSSSYCCIFTSFSWAILSRVLLKFIQTRIFHWDVGRRTCLEGFWLGLEMVLTEVGCFFSLIAEVNIAMGFILVCLVGWTGRIIIICAVVVRRVLFLIFLSLLEDCLLN